MDYFRTFDDIEFFLCFIDAKESREKEFRIEGVPITFTIGRNDGTTFCVCAHYDELLYPFTSTRGQTRSNIEVIETDHGDYVADYLDRVNNVIRKALSVPEVRERGIHFYTGCDDEDTKKPFFWTVFKENLREYVGWINGVQPLKLVA